MASIVKVPNNSEWDYDFIAFSFNGKHSYEDFGIYRVTKGGFYDEQLSPPMNDSTAEINGIDGAYFLSTKHQQKVFNIDIAFDGLTERQLRDLKIWLNGKEVADLWFAEAPYKVYSAKVTGAPKLSVVPFSDPTHGRIYKGEGSIEFTCYYPYAHTPDYVQVGNTQLDGRIKESYADFSNYLEIQSVLPGSGTTPYGELPFFFVADLDASDPSKSTRADKLTSIFEVSEAGNSVTISNTDYEGVPVRGTVVLGGE